MKSHKAPGLSELVAEMIQATGDMELTEYWIYVIICEKRLHSRGLKVKCGTINLQMERWPNGVLIL